MWLGFAGRKTGERFVSAEQKGAEMREPQKEKNEMNGEIRMDIKSLPLQELTEVLVARGEKTFRAKQMYDWMHVKLARGFREMTNLPETFRDECGQWCSYTALQSVLN